MGKIREETLVKLTEVLVGPLLCGAEVWKVEGSLGQCRECRGQDSLGDWEDAVSPQCELNMIGAKVRG